MSEMANIYKKDSLTISAGTVYDESRVCGRLIARADGGKVVKFYEKGMTDAEKQRISAFVAEADAAPEDRF